MSLELMLGNWLPSAFTGWPVWLRMNQVMHRAKLEPLPQGPFCELLPAARRQVAEAADSLLAGIPVAN